MDININENIKRLRRDKNITQEKLAEYLNVSTQAVSKWERNESLPDITMILPIASYFNVSTDELLGLDAVKNEAKISKYLDDIIEFINTGKWTEAAEIAINAHKEFPNEFRITHWYMQLIIGGNTDNPVDIVLSYADELTSLCEYIIDECTVDYIRNGAVDILAKVNKAQGNVDKALELLERFPDWYGCTKSQKSEQLFDKRTDEWWHWINYNFFTLSDFALNKLMKIFWFSDKSFEEKVNSTKRVIEYLLKILEETKYEPLYYHIFMLYSQIGSEHHKEGKADDVCKYYDIALSYAKKYDDFVASDKQIPYTKNKLKKDLTRDCSSSNKHNQVKRMLNWYENGSWFNELRKTDKYIKMLEKYKPFARDLI